MKRGTPIFRTSWLAGCLMFAVATPSLAQQSIQGTLDEAFRDSIDSRVAELELEADPNYQAHKRGDEQLRLGNYSAALREFEAAISLHPDDQVAYFKKGRALFLSGRLPEAVAAYKKSIELNKRKDAWSWAPQVEMGFALNTLGRFEEAEKSFGRSLALNPTAAAYTGRANSILSRPGTLNARQYEQALADLDASLKLAPNLAQTWAVKGMLYLRLDDETHEDHFDEACTALEKACRLGECKVFEQLNECEP